MDCHFCNLRDVPEGSRRRQQSKLIASSSRRSQRPVLKVRRVPRPRAQSLFDLGRPVAGRVVLVGEGEDVGGDGALVCLLEPGQAEGARCEETRCRIRHGRRLVRMERATVVFGRAVLISRHGQSLGSCLPLSAMYLLGGSSLFPRRLSLLRATGSKPLASSSAGGGTEKEEESSTWRRAEDGDEEALRRDDGWRVCTTGRTSLQRADAVRNGSSRNAMVLEMAGDGRCGSALASVRSGMQMSAPKSFAGLVALMQALQGSLALALCIPSAHPTCSRGDKHRTAQSEACSAAASSARPCPRTAASRAWPHPRPAPDDCLLPCAIHLPTRIQQAPHTVSRSAHQLDIDPDLPLDGRQHPQQL
jgi:hypothetical protein